MHIMPLIFQYGSNCNEERLNHKARLDGAAVDRGRAQTVEDHEIAFNVWSRGNGCAASNLMPEQGHHAWGVLYEVPADRIRGRSRPDGKRTLEEIEGKLYEEKSIRVRDTDGNEITEPVTTFLVKPAERRDGLWTSAEYVGNIIRGLRTHGVEETYIQHVIDMALDTNQQAAERAAEESRLIESLRPTPSP